MVLVRKTIKMVIAMLIPEFGNDSRVTSQDSFLVIAKLKLNYIKIIQIIFMVPGISKFKLDFY